MDADEFERECQGMWQRMAELEAEVQERIGALRRDLEALTGGMAAAPAIELPPVAPPEEPPPLPRLPSSPPPRAIVRVVKEREHAAARAVEPPAPPPVERPASASAERGSWELSFGKVWLVRLGVALLVTGLVLLGNFAYKNWIRELPAAVRLAALYLGAMGLSATGWWLALKDALKRFGEVLLAGGLAFFYWCTFAAHHVERLRVVESPVLGAGLLLAAAGVMVGVALRRDSRTMAMLGLLLACYSTVLQPLGWLSAVSNLVLAVSGVVLMRRPGWLAPGLAAMAGIYGSFVWWQLGGASGGEPEPRAALAFLPPVWLAFALPGIRGAAKPFASIADPVKARLTGGNNTAFFLLFSLVWLRAYGVEDYWRVPAAIGAGLTLLGAWGRPREAAGGVHLAQGLAALTLALVLKLEGFELALGAAIQAVVLAALFRFTRGRPELVFSVIAALLAGARILATLPLSQTGPVPWLGHTAVALLSILAGVVALKGLDHWQGAARELGRAGIALQIIGGLAVGLFGVCLKLPEPWPVPTLLAVAGVFGGLALGVDRRGRLPEGWLAAASYGFAALIGLVAGEVSGWMPWAAAVLAAGSHLLWQHVRRPAAGMWDPVALAPALTGLFAAAVAAGLWRGAEALSVTGEERQGIYALAAVALAAGARFLLRSPQLTVAAALLLIGALVGQWPLQADRVPGQFLPVLGGLAVVGALRLPGPAREAPEHGLSMWIARGIALLSWLLAWQRLAPAAWPDVQAVTALGLLLIARGAKSAKPPVEVACLGGIALFGAVGALLQQPWHELAVPPGLHGGGVVLVTLALPFLLRKSLAPAWRQAALIAGAALLALWSSQQLLWHEGGRPLAILWTGLGFGLVTAGLWQRLTAWRQAGFALLALALLKLFGVDVWEFNAFLRIVAFLALGVALVLLGFFYHRFADLLKKMMNDQ